MGKSIWAEKFTDGDFAVFRLTPDKYHYNHMPVSGRILDFYEIDGGFHSCNPCAIVSFQWSRLIQKTGALLPWSTQMLKPEAESGLLPWSKLALMIGDVVQCYEEGYDSPKPVTSDRIEKGLKPFSSGSSTDILLFEKAESDFFWRHNKPFQTRSAKPLFHRFQSASWKQMSG